MIRPVARGLSIRTSGFGKGGSQKKHMENLPIKIGEEVTIVQNKLKGIVNGIFIDRQKVPNFLVKYSDSNGAMFESYFQIDELSK